MCTCLDDDADVKDPELTQEDPAVNLLDDMKSVDAISDQPSDWIRVLRQHMVETYLTIVVVYRPFKLTGCIEIVESQVFYPVQQYLTSLT